MGSVTHTAGVNPWWQVDLGSNKNIEEIKIYNRTDANPQNLSNFTVTVTNTSGRTVFSKTYADYPNPFLVIETGDISGRIVKVQKNDIGTLTLAEVLIFATSQPLSINIYDEIKVSVFPNPTTDKLIISIPNNVLKRYTLYNLSGQMISTNNTNTKEVEINVSKLSMGIYFLKMEGDKFYGIHKIIKK